MAPIALRVRAFISRTCFRHICSRLTLRPCPTRTHGPEALRSQRRGTEPRQSRSPAGHALCGPWPADWSCSRCSSRLRAGGGGGISRVGPEFELTSGRRGGDSARFAAPTGLATAERPQVRPEPWHATGHPVGHNHLGLLSRRVVAPAAAESSARRSCAPTLVLTGRCGFQPRCEAISSRAARSSGSCLVDSAATSCA